jgi:hypothetical protein
MTLNFTFNLTRGTVIAAAGILVAVSLTGAAFAVTDTVFRYKTEHSGFLSLAPMAFAAADSDSATQLTATFPTEVSGSACMMTGVNLPQSAKITALAAWASTGNGVTGAAFTITLFRNNPSTSASDVIADASMQADSGRKALNARVTNAGLGQVDNRFYNYSVGICQSSTSDFYGARINYTYVTAGD